MDWQFVLWRELFAAPLRLCGYCGALRKHSSRGALLMSLTQKPPDIAALCAELLSTYRSLEGTNAIIAQLLDARQGWWIEQGRSDIRSEDSIHSCAAISLMQFSLLVSGLLNISNCTNVINSWVSPIAQTLRLIKEEGYVFLDPDQAFGLLKKNGLLPSSVLFYGAFLMTV